MKPSSLIVGSAVALVVPLVLPLVLQESFFYYVAYIVLEYIVLSSAWNILGGYGGYVNFGAAAWFGLGAYVSAFLFHAYGLGFGFGLLAGGAAGGALGFVMSNLTLRVRGIYFAISTFALVIVFGEIVNNTPAVGGPLGILVNGAPSFIYSNSTEFLFVVMAVLAWFSVFLSRTLEKSNIGRSLMAIRDDELAAESVGIATLRMKSIAGTLMGVLMGLAGAVFPYYIIFMSPTGVFSLTLSIYPVAMPLIGGAGTWLGPLIGSLIIGLVAELVTVGISSDLAGAIIAIPMVVFAILIPMGLVGIVKKWTKRVKVDAKNSETA